MLQTVMIVVWSLVCAIGGVYVVDNNPKIAARFPKLKHWKV